MFLTSLKSTLTDHTVLVSLVSKHLSIISIITPLRHRGMRYKKLIISLITEALAI